MPTIELNHRRSLIRNGPLADVEDKHFADPMVAIAPNGAGKSTLFKLLTGLLDTTNRCGIK